MEKSKDIEAKIAAVKQPGELSEEEAQLLHLLFASGLETAHIRAA